MNVYDFIRIRNYPTSPYAIDEDLFEIFQGASSSLSASATGGTGTGGTSTGVELTIPSNDGGPDVTVNVTVTGSDGSDGADGADGSDGSDGEDGSDGSDGSDGEENPVVEHPVSETPLDKDAELADLIWQGQNAKLLSENDYCDQLQKQFAAKQATIEGTMDLLLDFVGELLETITSVLVGGLILATSWGNPALAQIGAFLAELSVGFAFEALISLLTRGNELLMGIKEENTLLLEVEKSRENYEYRETALARHREDISMLLDQIREAEGS